MCFAIWLLFAHKKKCFQLNEILQKKCTTDHIDISLSICISIPNISKFPCTFTVACYCLLLGLCMRFCASKCNEQERS